MPLQLRRGLQAERDALVTNLSELSPGEPLWCTDTGNLYIGVESVVGGIHVNAPPEIDLSDYEGTIGEGPFIGVSNKTIDLENNITTNIIPRTSEIYDLGSESQRFGKLWLTSDGILIGDALITTNISGTTISLPADSTVGGELISTFAGFDEGDSLKINLLGIDDELLVDYEERSFIGKLFGDVDSTLVRSNQVNIFNNSDTITGSFLSLIKSRGTNDIPLSVQSGDEIGKFTFVAHNGIEFINLSTINNVVTGTVSDNIIPSSLVFSISNNSGVLTEAARFTSDSEFILSRNSVSDTAIIINSAHNSNNNAANIFFNRFRNTVAAPVNLINNDPIIDLLFNGYDGVSSIPSSLIRPCVDGTVSPGIVPGRIEFYVRNLSGSLSNVMTIKNDGSLRVSEIQPLDSSLTISGNITSDEVVVQNMFRLPSYANTTARDLAIAIPEGGMMIYLADTGSGSPGIQVYLGNPVNNWTNL
jgi:hypothetical protein